MHSAGLWSLSHDAQHLAHYFDQRVQLSSVATADVISQARLLDLGVPRILCKPALSWSWALDSHRAASGYSDLTRSGVLIISLDGQAAFAKVLAMLQPHPALRQPAKTPCCRSGATIHAQPAGQDLRCCAGRRMRTENQAELECCKYPCGRLR